MHPAFFLAAISALQYQPQALGQPSPANPAGITLSCDNFCNFIIKDKIIPARVEIDAAGRLKDLTLQFFDPNSGLIGYQDKSQEPIFYVINDQSELLQVVRLSLNHRSPLRFQNYFSNSRQILFTSDSGESFLYSADHPSLHLL